MSVRVRFAPSPTGYVHIGSLRTALYDYLYAKKHDGKYVLRIEDTDRTRLVDDALDNLLEAVEWAGVMHDEGPVHNESGEMVQIGDKGPYVQSERLHIYRPYVDQLIDEGHAYYCFCSKERLDAVREENKEKGIFSGYDGHCRDLSVEDAKKHIEAGESYVVRLKLPEDREVVIDDMVRGRVVMNTNDSDDQVLLKADGFPTYHLAVIVDDHLMGITHIIRGEEWLPSTPKHVILYEMFGWDVPKFAHLPNILNSEKKKLSKRHGDVSVADFRKKGYLPEALINFLALVGWSPEGDQEIMTMEEMIEKFSFDRVSKSGGVFDVQKLNWMSNHYIKEADLDRLTDLAVPYVVEAGYLTEDAVSGHKVWLSRIVDLSREYLEYMAQIPKHVELFVGQEVKLEDEEAKTMVEMDHVPAMLEVLKAKLDEAEEFDAASVKKAFKATQKESGVKGKNLFMCTRVALTGQVHGPDLMEIISILGRDLAKKRIDFTLENLCK
ncbi:glutamate--tRNA ligase [Fusibacter sp. JL216-2]|uniref:glutamate--tRNA ligase n=1 Tax=Fusibacter sp. JL216-2 TaxID=3071453 RepID=UPI003D346F58